MTKIVCISDTHGNFPKSPDGDVLVHSGDLTGRGTEEQITRGLDWLAEQKPALKILVPGNHDFFSQQEPEAFAAMCAQRDIVLLVDESFRAHGLNFYGSPWQPWFHNWAWNLQRGEEIRAKWDMIPRDTDVLITHGPPSLILDDPPFGGHVGCVDLWQAVRETRPRVHVFGHIHHGYGVTLSNHCQGTLFVNASLCNEQNQCVNPPITVHV